LFFFYPNILLKTLKKALSLVAKFRWKLKPQNKYPHKTKWFNLGGELLKSKYPSKTSGVKIGLKCRGFGARLR